MREPQRKRIGDFQYIVSPMSPIMASKLLTRLLKTFGEPIGKLAALAQAQGGVKSVLDSQIDGDALADAFKSLAMNLSEDEMETMLKKVINPVFVSYENDEGKAAKLTSIDGHFTGEGDNGLAGMFKLAAFVLETNYKDFLGGLVG